MQKDPAPNSTLLDRMKSTSKGSSDNFQTPPEGIDYLLEGLAKGGKPLSKNKVIWDPCAGEGQVVEYFESNGYKAFGTDINDGTDFLSDLYWNVRFEHPKNTTIDWDVIITNPPYSLKDQFLSRCYSLQKPFALLLPITALGGKKRLKMYQEHGMQLILPPKRINFKTPSGKKSSNWFYTAWFTHGFDLNKEIVYV